MLNGINIANLWPIYVAVRAYFENYILRNFAFYRFSKSWLSALVKRLGNFRANGSYTRNRYIKGTLCILAHIKTVLKISHS